METQKKLEKIYEKYSQVEHNPANYQVGGGLAGSTKFASNRHEDALNDEGKVTLGKANQMFGKATGVPVVEVRELIDFVFPDLEWHHAGKLPKSYGGGMKKTYFLKAEEICELAKNWNSNVEKLAKSKIDKEKAKQERQELEAKKDVFLKENAKKIERASARPPLFHETDKEMEGKYGWFSSYGKSYKLPQYYSGWQFESEVKFQEFLDLKYT